MAKGPGSVGAAQAHSAVAPRPASPARGPRPAHTRDRIAAAAVAVADADGIEAVTMRRVAAGIGTRATSLYRYVSRKEDLLDLMVELVTGETSLPEPSGDWRRDLRAIAHHGRGVVKRHPWMVTASVFRSPLGPNGLAATEATLKALDGHGLDIDAMLVIATALATFTRGYAAGEIAEQQAEARSGLGREQWMASQARRVEAIRAARDHPLVMRVIDEARAPHDPRLVRDGFGPALDCLLDGIAGRLS